jgi:hypothetical protein
MARQTPSDQDTIPVSPLSAQNADQAGLNRITQAVFSTSTWHAFARQSKTGRL